MVSSWLLAKFVTYSVRPAGDNAKGARRKSTGRLALGSGVQCGSS
jgi:hypothetical protein